LRLLSDFNQAEPRPSIFTAAYRQLLAHQYNLLIPADAHVLEIGCGEGDLLNLINATDMVDIDLSSEQVNGRKHGIRCLGRGLRSDLFSLLFLPELPKNGWRL
jgi:cyclopropane fatty-acyl-phospholipid synthase-like methyltransferase